MGHLTFSQYARLHAVISECPWCGAHRGEFCKTRKGRVLDKGWHTARGMMTRYFRRAKPEVYQRLWEEVQR